ncbi:MAG: UDP-2,3-diacylglucosamine diphosphatase [Gammaproteobacteria bacterium]|nr:UDP-2,3-diacylglucosamine diphosphatase [Gammaproteobacteria bacterium]
MATLFVSDLHLTTERPASGQAFLDLLESDQARQAEALYILGDLFEIWLGDDAVVDEYRSYIEALKRLSESGVPLYFIQGNRDFLTKSGFEAMTGARILDHHTVIDLYGIPTLLMHGDLLCTDDVDYLKFRDMILSRQWQDEFLSKSVNERVEYGRMLREKSREAMQGKQEMIMDVNQQAVEDTMREFGVTHLIHGHTHRPAVHHFELDGKTVTRTVLPDWYEQGGVLRCDETGCEFQPVPS